MILFFDLSDMVIKDRDVSEEFFSRFRAKLKSPFNLLSFPYSKTLLERSGDVYAFLLDIAWFPFYWIGLLGLLTCFVLGLGFGWFILPGIMSVLYLFWSPSLYLFLFKQGLMKAGFKGKVKRLKSEEFIWRLHHGSD